MKADSYNPQIKIFYQDSYNYDLAETIIQYFWANSKDEDYIFEAVKDDKSEVYRLKTPEDVYYLKHYQLQKFSKKFKNIFRKPEGVRHFKTATKLSANNIPAVEPILGITRNRNLFVADSLLVTREIKGMTLLEYANSEQKSDIRKIIITRLAKLWARLINNKFWHKDPRLFNIMIKFAGDGFKLILVDIDNIYSLPYFPHRLVLKNLTKLSTDMLKDMTNSQAETLTINERLLFFEKFARAYKREVYFRKFINKINERVAKRLARKDYSEITM